jgi:hypothetical protein
MFTLEEAGHMTGLLRRMALAFCITLFLKFVTSLAVENLVIVLNNLKRVRIAEIYGLLCSRLSVASESLWLVMVNPLLVGILHCGIAV